MKNKAIAAILSAIMLVSSASVPAYARYTPDTSDYVYKETDDLQAEIDHANNDSVVLTWPAVDKEGNIIKANPLRAEGQTNSNGNPTAGWTNPTNGMIIEYSDWLPDGTHTTISNDNKSEHNVLMGVVDTPTEYPIYIKDPKISVSNTNIDDPVTSGAIVKAAYIDTTVVATSFATAYQIQYSLDGENWIEDHIASTINHGKKLSRIVEKTNDETGKAELHIVDDAKNTFFLEDQITEALTKSLEPETKYYIRVRAYDASEALTGNDETDKDKIFKTFTTEITTPKKAKLAPAFPTVEGGGTYSQGGRGGDVYVVTNLTDSVSDPQPGSLRYGLLRKDRADGNSLAPRTIVFAVGGTIHIDENAAKSERRININSNTTVLGQTAPGEGITIAGSSMKFSGENIIVRYMRFRLGGGYDLDAATASGKNIVIDHCTFSWGVDEVFTAKELINSSIQYNIISSGLAMPNKNGVLNSDAEVGSGESEAKHGMGSILNGYEVSYTHNLWAHNGTRNPRFEGGFDYNSVRYENSIDYANNVVYDWGHNSTYGGERGKGRMNFVGNYYKPGPETLEKVKYQLFDCDAAGALKGSYYISGNVMTSDDGVTNDNTLGFKDTYTLLSEPVNQEIPYEAESAEAAYVNVLNGAGASLVRDAQDNRLIYEVANGLGGFINSEAEAGGFSDEEFTATEADSDNDGIPDVYEEYFGTKSLDDSDSCLVIEDEASPYNGYSYIEVYAGMLCGDWENTVVALEPVPEAPKAVVTAITDGKGVNVMAKAGNTTLVSGKTYTVALSENVNAKLYLNDKAQAGLTFTAGDTGIYNLACLMSAGGERSFTPAVPVTVVKGESNLDGFNSVDIGRVGAKGADNYDTETGVLYSQGAGRIGSTNTSSEQGPDKFHYNYKLVKGDFQITAQMDNIAKIDYFQKSGLMARATLAPDSEFYMAALTYFKGEDLGNCTDVSGESIKARNIAPMARTETGAGISQFATNSGVTNTLGIATLREDMEPIHGWGRIARSGSTVTISASLDGVNWYTLREFADTTLPDICYVGFATSAAQDTGEKVRYNVTEFSNISVSSAEEAVIWGDADRSGGLTANDAAATLAGVLYRSSLEQNSRYDFTYCSVDGDEELSANDAALILQKVLDSGFVFPAEK